MKNLFYSAPVTEILSLASMQETMQSASQHSVATGQGITYDTESDFDDFFSN